MNNIAFAVPHLAEQQLIAEYLDDKCASIDSVIEQKTNLIEELESYKKSLIFEYVTGKKEVL
jgi:type I restriction enzyme S subunit